VQEGNQLPETPREHRLALRIGLIAVLIAGVNGFARAQDEFTADAADNTATVPANGKTNANRAEIAAHLSEGAGAAIVPASLTSAPRAPWGVQVAGNFSQARAIASYRTLQQKFPNVIGNRPPLILSSVAASRGRAPFYAIRLPANTRDAADELCNKLHAVGGACVVMKNAR